MYGQPLQVAEAIGGIVGNDGRKVVVYKYYESELYEEQSDRRQAEVLKFRARLDKMLFELGYTVADLQFLVLSSKKKVDLDNIVLIDTDFLAPLVTMADNYKGRRANIDAGEYKHRPKPKHK